MTLRDARTALALCLLALMVVGAPFILKAGATERPEITIKDFDFGPMSLTIKAGAAVTWKNLDGEPHTVVSEDGLFRSTALDEGDTFSFTFTKPGTYKYDCSIHPQMHGTIIVQ